MSSPPASPASPAPQTFATSVLGDVAHALTSEGFDASEDGTGRGSVIVALTSSAAAPPARTSPSPDAAPASTASEAPSSGSSCGSQMSLFAPEDGCLSRTSPVSSVPVGDGISLPSSGRWPTSGFGTWPTAFWTQGTSAFPSDGGVSSSLPDVLEATVPARYSLSPRAAAGILRRATKRGRELPEALRMALESLAHSPATQEEAAGTTRLRTSS